MELKTSDSANVIVAQSHFIKTVEDVYEALATAVPGIKFGIAFNEGSGPRLVRTDGNDGRLTELAARNALDIGTGHLLVIMVENAFPINVMHAMKAITEITTIYCASSNPLKAVVLRDGEGASLLGIIDGLSPKGVETDTDKRERHEFLRKIGYKR